MSECPDSQAVAGIRAACRRGLDGRRAEQVRCQVREWFRRRPGQRADVDTVANSTGLARDDVQGVLIDLCVNGELVQKMHTVYSLPAD